MTTKEWYSEALEQARHKLEKKYVRVEQIFVMSVDAYCIAHYTCLDKVSNIIKDEDHHLIEVQLVNHFKRVAGFIHELTNEEQFVHELNKW